MPRRFTDIVTTCPNCSAVVTLARDHQLRTVTASHPEPIDLDCDAAILAELVPEGWSYAGSQTP